MKTPISYYGGKQKMLEYILPLIPKHNVYVEPFFGGGAVFFAKPPSKIEFINDLDDRVVNFYFVLKTKFNELKQMADASLHSDYWYNKSKEILNNKSYSDVERAFAFWYNVNNAYNSDLNGGLSFGKYSNKSNLFQNKKNRFTIHLSQRLENTTILNRDAIKVIEQLDGEETFFFIDPPYVSANMGHYDFYTKDEFLNLINTLKNVKGKFLLTTYDEPELKELANEMNWKQIKIEMQLSASGKKAAKKIEVITMNYNISNGLFDTI